jgi:hypothetical protein
MITTHRRQDAQEMHWATSATNGMAPARALTQSPEESDSMDNLYKIVSLSLLFFDAIVKPFDRMIEEEEEELFGI